jgi:hypothetical protein
VNNIPQPFEVQLARGSTLPNAGAPSGLLPSTIPTSLGKLLPSDQNGMVSSLYSTSSSSDSCSNSPCSTSLINGSGGNLKLIDSFAMVWYYNGLGLLNRFFE